MNTAIMLYHQSASEAIHTAFEIETLADDCLFTEGPVYNREEGYYLFSDITANVVYRIVPGGTKEVFIQNSGTDNVADPDLKPDQAGSNGLAYLAGDLLVCRHGGHSIDRWAENSLQPFIGSYSGWPFNSPNDLIVHSDGRVFFSDPPYGLKEGKLNPAKFQPAAYLYVYDKGEVKIVSDKYQYPNGCVLSLDESVLYVCSNKPFEAFVAMYDTTTYAFKGIFTEETSDGIERDEQDNIYLCNKEGILIYNKAGIKLAKITLPTVPANCCWGGPEGKDLLITAREKVFLIRNLQVGGKV